MRAFNGRDVCFPGGYGVFRTLGVFTTELSAACLKRRADHAEWRP